MLSATQVAPPSTDSRSVETNPATPQSLGRGLIERIALVVFGLYHLPLFLNNYRSLGGVGFSDGLAVSWGQVFTPPGVWWRGMFQITGPMPTAYNGDSGDVCEEFGRLLLAVVIGVVAAVSWTIADRKRPRSRWTGDAPRLLLRYSIALGLASFAIGKILPNQFPPISTIVLEQPVGDLTPMNLLWTFMEYSRPYAFFAGLMQMLSHRRSFTPSLLKGDVRIETCGVSLLFPADAVLDPPYRCASRGQHEVEAAAVTQLAFLSSSGPRLRDERLYGSVAQLVEAANTTSTPGACDTPKHFRRCPQWFPN